MSRNSRRRNKSPKPTVQLPTETRTALELVERARVQAPPSSQQPRFGQSPAPDVFYSDVSRWLTFADLQEPDYSANSWRRDQWLRKFWRLEPHLSGVMKSVVDLDKNRGWSLTGGRNQVYRMTDILHASVAAPGLTGWRNFISSQSLSYYATDMCTVAEVGREGQGGPMRALYHTDSARCTLTGNPETPLKYQPNNGKGQLWPWDTFFRVVSMPNDDEAYNGLGFCAISRVLELAKLMVAIFRKDSELLGARMPEGLLLLKGIQQGQWDDAMADREAKLTAKERKYFGGVFVLATAGIDQVDAKLIALRQLPENFNLQVFTDQLMFAYALTFGYSPREFWPVSSGALGTATEAETQDANSTGKGESDFILNYGEQLNLELPDAILFEFDSRDAKGDLELVQILQAKADFIDTMAQIGLTSTGTGVPLLDNERLLELANEHELIPDEWLIAPQDTTATDSEGNELARLREKARTNLRVQRALARFPNEPIIRYHYPTQKETVLWEDAADFRARRTWTGFRAARRDVAQLTRAIREVRHEIATRQQLAELPAPR